MSTSLLVSPCVLLEAVFVVEPPPNRVDIVINFCFWAQELVWRRPQIIERICESLSRGIEG